MERVREDGAVGLSFCATDLEVRFGAEALRCVCFVADTAFF